MGTVSIPVSGWQEQLWDITAQVPPHLSFADVNRLSSQNSVSFSK